MPIEILVPIGIFVAGMIVSHFASASAVRLVEENLRNK